jgi:Big-like domain-containing protein
MFAASMKKFSAISLPVIIVITLIGVVSGQGCANIIPPEGGLKDSIPPLLVKASPPDSSSNFSEKRITLTFDEYIQLQNATQELIMSPVPKQEPVIESKLRTLTIRLKDTLEANTTYTLNFGNSVRDINEGNIARNFTYIFSTGSTFDSLTLSGKVKLAANGKVDTTLVVMLHKSGDDSAVVNEKPRYLTRLDSSGNFRFRNLPGGTFYIYALQDQGNSHRYQSEKQLFAFADSAVTLEKSNKPILLYAYAEQNSATPPVSSRPQITTRPKPNASNSEKRLKIQTNASNGQLDLFDSLVLSFEVPLKNLDTTLIHFSSDSSFTPLTNYHFLTDSTQKKLILKYNWQENTRYNLILEKDFAMDTLGRALLKADTVRFKTKKVTDYGTIRIRFKNFDASVNPVLLFIQNDNPIRSFPLSGAQLNQSLFPPGEYELRVLYDRNKNGKWDPGQFFGKHIQPELVKPVGRKVTIKANWDNEFDIAL